MKTPRKTVQEWSNLLADCKARPKGIRISDWCSQQGINLGTYKYWQKKMSRHQREPSADSDIQFIPLAIPAQTAAPVHHHADISIKYKDFEIVVTEHSSHELLAKLLMTVRTSC